MLALRGDSLRALARRLGCSYSHLTLVLRGKRGLSSNVSERLFGDLGGAAWRFILGQVDELRVEDVA